MINIKRWIFNRDQSLEKSEPVEQVSLGDFMKALESELGVESRAAFGQLIAKHVPFILSKEFAPDHMGLSFLTKYLSVPGYRQEKLDEQPSNFHRQLLEKSVYEFGTWAASALKNLTLSDVTPEDLTKAVMKKDWNRITKKNNPEAEMTVPAKPHITQFPVHPEHAKMLNDKNLEMAGHKLDKNGISAKMVHELDSGDEGPTIYMAKPYHKNIESATKSWVKNPILGWATMATKALFNAGGIGDKCEDVTAHEHEGVPLTVHRFAHDYIMGAHPRHSNIIHQANRGSSQYSPDPVDIHKIGVMDYLTNNLDRHNGNILVRNHSDENGYHPPLAIDHERNMQYSKILREGPQIYRPRKDFSTEPAYQAKETPFTYIVHSALSNLHHKDVWSSHENLVDWWSKHGQKIKDEMESQVGNIKDEAIRTHVRDNFNNRWHQMNNWNNAMKADPDGDNMYDIKSLHHAFADTRNLQMNRPRITSAQLKALPKNKTDALVAIADMVTKKGNITPKQRSLLQSAIHRTLDQMTPEEAGEAFRSLADNPYLDTKAIKNEPAVDPRRQMLEFFSAPKWENNEPVRKFGHMDAIANAIDTLEPHKKEILKWWANHFRQLMSEKEAA
jgi:hypothetical protein